MDEDNKPAVKDVYCRKTGDKITIKANRFNPEIHSEKPCGKGDLNKEKALEADDRAVRKQQGLPPKEEKEKAKAEAEEAGE